MGGSTRHAIIKSKQLYIYKDGPCLSVTSTGATGQDSAGFLAARWVEGAAHSLLSARTATRCAAFPLISDGFATQTER